MRRKPRRSSRNFARLAHELHELHEQHEQGGVAEAGSVVVHDAATVALAAALQEESS